MNMNKLSRWAAKNHILATVTMGVGLDLVYIVAMGALDAPIWAMVVISVLLILVCYAKVLSIRTKLVDDAARERLQFVITSGKKLYAVTEARELLAKSEER